MADTIPALSPAEKKANAARLEAEAALALAEARKAAAEAEIVENNLRGELIRVNKLVEDEEARHATDENNHVYRFEGSVSGESVTKCMAKLTQWHRQDPECTIEVIFSSPGGSIFDGMKLFDFIVELGNAGHKTITGGIGMAASMAGILVQAGQHRYVTRENWFLIHRAAFGAMGSTYQVEDTVELIKRIEKRIIEIFTSRSGGKLTAARIKRNWERKDWWLSSDECLELGLVDEVRSLPGTGTAEGA